MTSPKSRHTAALVYSDALSQHVLSPNHPMRPIRLRYMHELMRASGLLGSPELLQAEPREATREEIARYHGDDYIDVVRTISSGGIALNMHEFGIGPGDNPPRRGMYESSALVAGGTLVAAELAQSGRVAAAFAPAGGVHHHAMANRASGFGVFNDAVIAIEGMAAQGLRVAYVDIDCHHGDGVQAAFYGTDRVLTISIHESGQWLFPGSGFVGETGEGEGEGYSVNIPLAPYTQDALWHRAFDELIPPLVRAYRPDVVFAQLGIDTHFRDPLTHLQLTTQGFTEAVRKLHALGQEAGVFVAVGGGGYDMGAVARAWTMAMAELAGFELPKRVPESYDAVNGLTTFADDPGPAPLPADTAEQVEEYAEGTIEEVKKTFFKRLGVE
jgi:acetoin utilization protein AcuC